MKVKPYLRDEIITREPVWFRANEHTDEMCEHWKFRPRNCTMVGLSVVATNADDMFAECHVELVREIRRVRATSRENATAVDF